MTLAPGTRRGPYEVVSSLGAGGMGEVYRARDSKLNREIALKILPATVVADPARLQRFEREAQVLASLNHPNIAALYGLEESGPSPALVMELVEGQTLQERIGRGAVPVSEALAIARQICDALEAAHAKGIIHRDLKPANVKITPEGQVKVLDFGLAKALEGDSMPVAAGSDGHSPTLTMAATRAGVILGTAGYMSPEQMRGAPVDKRADIWAFGVVLYEMLTGQVTFPGETAPDTLASVLKSEIDFGALPAETPACVRRVLRRCLERDRKRRMHDIADVRLDIDTDAESPAPAAAEAAPTARVRAAWLPWTAAAAAILAAGLLWWQRTPPPPATLATQFLLQPPPGMEFALGSHAVAPDGRRLLLRVREPNNTSGGQLVVRDLGSTAYLPLPRTEMPGHTAWSPDSRSILFLQAGKLKRLDLGSGVPVSLCDAPGPTRGMAWNEQGTILIGSSRGPIQRVSSGGGIPSDVTKLTASETGHGFPNFLPGGRWFLYTAFGSPESVTLGDLEGREPPRRLFPIGGGETVLAVEPGEESGVILYRRENALAGVRFDLRRRAVVSDPFPLVERLPQTMNGGLAASVSRPARVLLYNDRPGVDLYGIELVLLDRRGRKVSTLSPATEPSWGHLEFSPDDARLLGNRTDTGRRQQELWILDLVRNVPSRITFDPVFGQPGIWSPDGRRVYFAGGDGNVAGLFAVAADGAGKPELILKGMFHHLGITPDGRQIAFELGSPGAANTIGLVSLDRPGSSEALIGGSFAKAWPQFSPDGRWLAYASAESGRYEIHVQSHPPGRGKWQVSRGGGRMARWRRDGKELVFHEGGGRFLSVGVRRRGETLEFGKPVPLFETKMSEEAGGSYFAMTGDGQRFALHAPQEGARTPGAASSRPLTVMTEWMAAIRR